MDCDDLEFGPAPGCFPLPPTAESDALARDTFEPFAVPLWTLSALASPPPPQISDRGPATVPACVDPVPSLRFRVSNKLLLLCSRFLGFLLTVVVLRPRRCPSKLSMRLSAAAFDNRLSKEYPIPFRTRAFPFPRAAGDDEISRTARAVGPLPVFWCNELAR